MNPQPKISQPGRRGSKKSLESYGIKNAARNSAEKSNSSPKLQPEGVADLPETVYDSIVFYIYCGRHDKIAISRPNRNEGCSWLPFVMMNSRLSWLQASKDGVSLLIGRQDSEISKKEAEKFTPKFDVSGLHLLRIQDPSRKIVTRLAQYINVVNNDKFLCCLNNAYVEWHPSADIMRNKVPGVWGPEMRLFSSMVLNKKPKFNSEFTLSDACSYLKAKGTPEQALLKSIGLTDIKVYHIFKEFLDHCYPSFYMCLDSFAVFLKRFGWKTDEKMFQRLFTASAFLHKWYVDFHELLIALIVMEPNVANSNELRLRFLFNAYDSDLKGYLNEHDIQDMTNDIKNNSHGSIESMQNSKSSLSRWMKSGKIGHKEFLHILTTQHMNSYNHLCRSPKSILEQITNIYSHRTNKDENNKHKDILHPGEHAKDKGTCKACLPGQYCYGAHSVKIDTMGRCVEPIIVSNLWNTSEKSREKNKQIGGKIDEERYSLETVFDISSVPNVFMDLVSSFLNSETTPKTIFNPQNEWKTFKTYVSILFSDLKSLLKAENKLIRVNAPCLIFSDLQGNIQNLGYLKKSFFPSFPVIPENLLFLGNYSGGWPNAVEVIIYLFSMKVLSPNKVFLIRGNYELNVQNAKGLLKECSDKYGTAYGKELFDMMMNVFYSMPVAVLVDDNIFCSNTGIPKTDKVDHLEKCLESIRNAEAEQPMAFEILTRYPNGTPKSIMQKSAWFKISRHSSRGSLSNSSLKSLSSIEKSHANSQGHSHSHSNINIPKSRSHTNSHSSHGSSRSASNKSLNSGSSKTSLHGSSSNLSNGPSRSPSHGSSPQLSSGSRMNNSQKTNRHKSNQTHIMKKGKSFLNKRSVFKPCPLFLKHKKRKSIASMMKTNADTRLYKKRSIAFDKREFEEFLRENDITFMVRGSSPADKGFKLQFENRCISIFSVCNYKDRKNQGSVVLIDGDSQRLRIIRFDSSEHIHHNGSGNSNEVVAKRSSSTIKSVRDKK